MSTGYGITDKDGNVLVSTVSPTERGAMVNWLYSVGILITNSHHDDQIKEMFNHVKDANGVRMSKVSITEMQ